MMSKQPIDFKQGLRHCDNDLRIYTAVLQQFQLQYRSGLNIGEIVNSEQHALLELHTLKGLTASIGASSLSDIAASSYQQWQSLTDRQKQQQLEHINDCLNTTLSVIGDYLNNN